MRPSRFKRNLFKIRRFVARMKIKIENANWQNLKNKIHFLFRIIFPRYYFGTCVCIIHFNRMYSSNISFSGFRI